MLIKNAMTIEQMGSAMCQSKKRMSSEEMMTPTLPIVSARMCKNTPSKILFSLPPCECPWLSCECPWQSCECPWPSACECPWPPSCEWPWWFDDDDDEPCEWPCEHPLPPCECPCSPPCWNTNMPTKFTKKPITDTTNKRSWCISGGAANLYKFIFKHLYHKNVHFI